MLFRSVHKHQGHIQLETALGEGSTFKLLFPLAPVATDDTSPQAITYLPDPDKNILLVSDDMGVSMLWKELLDVSGYQVSIRNTGQEALELIKLPASDIDLVIADQSMKGMSGEELAAAVVAEELQLPVIVCENNGGVEVVDHNSMGVSTILRKPIQSEVLMGEISSLLSTEN